MRKPIIYILIAFMIISVLTLYSATCIIPTYMNNIFIKQFIWYLISFLIIVIIRKIKIKNYIWSLYIICNFLLLFLLLFAPSINNAKCWFILPFGLGTFQPSELMKIILVLTIAWVLDKQTLDRKSIKEEAVIILKVGIIVSIPSVLTFLEPDTGNVIIYWIIAFSMLFTTGIRYKWFISFLAILVLGVVIILLIYFFKQDLFIKLLGSDFFLRIDRLLDWSNQSGYQLEHGLMAMGSGSLFGIGIKKITPYFPEAQTDFIFASFASTFGFIGSVIFVGLIITFDVYLLKQAYKSKNDHKFIIVGIVSMLFYQQFQNIGMTLGLLPITGITLPFISYGGSSLISYALAIGIILMKN